MRRFMYIFIFGNMSAKRKLNYVSNDIECAPLATLSDPLVLCTSQRDAPEGEGVQTLGILTEQNIAPTRGENSMSESRDGEKYFLPFLFKSSELGLGRGKKTLSEIPTQGKDVLSDAPGSPPPPGVSR